MSGEPGVIRCKGVNGTVIFDGTWVSIDRGKGMLGGVIAPYGTGEKRLALAQIASVNWKKPSAFASGFISFTLSGGSGRRSLFDTVDENKVTVAKSRENEFLALKAAVEEALAQHHAPMTAAASAVDLAEQLKKLADLHQSDLLTDEEFAAKRAVIVDQL